MERTTQMVQVVVFIIMDKRYAKLYCVCIPAALPPDEFPQPRLSGHGIKHKEALVLSELPSRMEVQPMNFYLAMVADHRE